MTGGGFTLVAAPPATFTTATAGWFIGGRAPGVSTVDRITYATDTATASVRGSLTAATYKSASTGNTTAGWVGGLLSGSTAFDRITYATDTNTATSVGAMGLFRTRLTASTDGTTYGWYVGGAYYTTVDRLIYANDTATASVRGPLSTASGYLAASGSVTNGWFGGGYNPSSGILSVVQRITYATDTATSSTRGPLSVVAFGPAATGSDNYGWYAGGLTSFATPYTARSTVQRVDFSNDTATASVRGPLSSGTYSFAATTDYSTYGWFGGGQRYGPLGKTSAVQRITYATDTTATSARGPLSAVKYSLNATSGIQ